MRQSKEIKHEWKGPKDFTICFSLIFSCYGESLISGEETMHWALQREAGIGPQQREF